MRLLVNHMQGKIYINIIRYKRELRFTVRFSSLRIYVNFKFRLDTHVMVCQ